MITNERQYRITKGWVERFTQAQEGVAARSGTLARRGRRTINTSVRLRS